MSAVGGGHRNHGCWVVRGHEKLSFPDQSSSGVRELDQTALHRTLPPLGGNDDEGWNSNLG